MRLFNKNDSEDDKSVVERPEAISAKIEEKSLAPASDGMRLVEEDALLVQIDAFRDKAEKLQSLINDRQNKVLELEDVVRDKEAKNAALKEELSIKQEALEGVLEDIKSQLNIFADRLDTSVNNAVNDAKEPVLEKVHSENVRLYRNLYDFMKEEYNEKKLEEIVSKSQKGSSLLVKLAVIFSIINTGMLVYLLLHSLMII